MGITSSVQIQKSKQGQSEHGPFKEIKVGSGDIEEKASSGDRPHLPCAQCN